MARAILLRQLAAAPRSRAQLAEKLAARDVPEELSERLLDRFEEVGLVDDAAYAEMLVRSRHQERGLARRALSHELRLKGIAPEVAEHALEQIDDDDEHTAALDLAVRKARSNRGLDPVKRRRRLAGMLARKGYSPGVAMRAVDEALAAEGQPDEDRGWDEPG
ncbi:regulatory protein RecX [Georgenia sp. H159]|uniref:regulatory protein RecX n=1 Tax=Georgenia sp. H159 TaxID=3076115 RepID=UPI002D778AC9|nr:regulatory protein RecX [Georgenia sp. H159]